MEGCDAVRRTVAYMQAGQQVPEDLFAVPGLPGFNPNSDGTAVRKAGRLTAAVAADTRFVQGFMTVSEGEVGARLRDVEKHEGKRREPAGVLAEVARAKYARDHPATPRRGDAALLLAIRSGANVSDELFDTFMAAAAKHDKARAAQAEAARLEYLAGMYALGKLASQPAVSLVKRARGRVLSGTFPRF
jgi:hypothetical protein